jgi:hypothetical protein
MKDAFANGVISSDGLCCSICLRNFTPSTSSYAKCYTCGLLVELSCLSSFFPRVTSSTNWSCPHCDKGQDKMAMCEICGYTRGFLCPLLISKSTNYHWIHPFCGCFHKEFKKNREENFFIRESEEHVNTLRGKGREKEYKKLCEYCKRDIGYTKQCTICARSSIHAICAYKANALQVVTTPSKEKLTTKKILCPNCNTIKNVKRKCIEKVLDALTSEYQLMEDNKGVLEGIMNLIMEADILKVFRFDKLIINLLPEDVEVLYKFI